MAAQRVPVDSTRLRRRAAAVCELLSSNIKTWAEFLRPDTDVPSRRQVSKPGKIDVRSRHLSRQIQQYCYSNFEGMDKLKLSALYDAIKAGVGLEEPLLEFERKYAKVSPRARSGCPDHATVVISLQWGLQFKVPEDALAKDVVEAVELNRGAVSSLKKYWSYSLFRQREQKEEIASVIRRELFACRMVLLSCFNLVEAFVNGIAWKFSLDEQRMKSLSNKSRKLIEDGSIREKLLKYPTRQWKVLGRDHAAILTG